MKTWKLLLATVVLLQISPVYSYTETAGTPEVNETSIPEEVILSAHRGGSYAPENTLMAFKQAQKAGVNSVEFDVRKSRSGFVVIHDRNTDRTTEENLVVSKTSNSRLTELSAGEDYNSRNSELYVSSEKAAEATVPTYKEALDYLGRTDILLRLEIKGKAQRSRELGRELYREVEKRNMTEQTVFMSFSGTCIPRVFGRICNWEALEGIENASSGEARTAVLWQKRRDPRKDIVDIKNLDIRYVLNEAESEGFDIVVARDGGSSVNGLRQSSITRKQFVEEAERRNLSYAFMGFRGSRKEQIECGVEWVSTNYPASLVEKVQSYENLSLDNCEVEDPASLADVSDTFQEGLTGKASIESMEDLIDWVKELLDNSISVYKRLQSKVRY